MLVCMTLQLINYWLFSLFCQNILLICYISFCSYDVFVEKSIYFWNNILVLITKCNWSNRTTWDSRSLLEWFIFCYLIIRFWVFLLSRTKCYNLSICVRFLLLGNMIERWSNIRSYLRKYIRSWREARFHKLSVRFPYVRKLIVGLKFSRFIITIVTFPTGFAWIQRG